MINFAVTEKEINEYEQAQPFPHIVIDDFLPTSLLNDVINDFKNYQAWGWDDSNYSKNHQVKKFFSPWNENGHKELPINIKLILDHLNSPETVSMLEKLTGINGLIADPTLLGGGMHRIDSGGKLSIHADSRKHSETGTYRRINLLVYLNKNWNEDWGGSLQLWDKSVTTMVQDIQPIFNRAVIFTTGADTYHGHPHPLNTPNDISRISLALYYYTKENPDTEENGATSAVWKNAPIEIKKDELTDSRSIFDTAQTYQDSGMYEEAIKWYRLYAKSSDPQLEENFESSMRIANCMMALGYSIDDIEAQMSIAINLQPDRAEPHYCIGRYCNQTGEYKKAYAYLKDAKSKNYNDIKDKHILFIQENMYGDNNNDELSVACFWTDRFEEGYTYLLEILNDDRFSNSKDRLLMNQKYFQDRLGIPHN